MDQHGTQCLQANYSQLMWFPVLQLVHTVVVKSGSPGQQICEIAKELQVHYVVMGSRGLNTLRRTFLGSVSDYVLHHVGVPVSIFPPEET